MRTFLFSVFAFFHLPIFSQAPAEEDGQVVVCGGEMPPPHDSVFELFDLQKLPVFPGGQQELLNFLVENIYWPKGCEERYGIIAVQFVIDTTGNCSDVKILKTPGRCFEPVVADIFAKMPRWEPGERAGRRVPTRFVMPIRIRLE